MRPQWLADKQVTLLMQGALKNEPELGDLPNALDFIKNDADRKVMELHFTQKTAARPLVAPPEVPAERVALLRKAFEALAQDKEFLAEMDKAKMEFGFVPGAEIDKIVAQIAATPPEIAERYAKARFAKAFDAGTEVAPSGCHPLSQKRPRMLRAAECRNDTPPARLARA